MNGCTAPSAAGVPPARFAVGSVIVEQGAVLLGCFQVIGQRTAASLPVGVQAKKG